MLLKLSLNALLASATSLTSSLNILSSFSAFLRYPLKVLALARAYADRSFEYSLGQSYLYSWIVAAVFGLD